LIFLRFSDKIFLKIQSKLSGHLQNHVLIFTTDSSDKHGFLCLFLAKPRWWGLHPWGFFDYSLLRKQACLKWISQNLADYRLLIISTQRAKTLLRSLRKDSLQLPRDGRNQIWWYKHYLRIPQGLAWAVADCALALGV